MKVLQTTTQQDEPLIDPYEHPVEYLAALGIEAELIAAFETPQVQAA